jgi:hypothetical protein
MRYDYSQDEWFMREMSFLGVEGSLFAVSADDEEHLCLVELDARRLQTWLAKAVGPLPETSPEEAAVRSARDLVRRA